MIFLSKCMVLRGLHGAFVHHPGSEWMMGQFLKKKFKFKLTYLGEFFMDFKIFNIFEQEIIHSRA